MISIKQLIFFLFIGLLISSCNENDENIDVLVIKDGQGIVDIAVSLALVQQTSGNMTFYHTTTDDNGLATINTLGEVFDPSDQEVVILATANIHCGFTDFLGSDIMHTIEIPEDELVEIQVLSPMLQDVSFTQGDTISVVLEVTSSSIPLNFRSFNIEDYNGNSAIQYASDINGIEESRPNASGQLEFIYVIHEGTNGFDISYMDKDTNTQIESFTIQTF